MKLVHTPSYSRVRERIIGEYACFDRYFSDLENAIVTDPYAAAEEAIIFQDRHIHARKRYVKTTFFSGLLPDVYLYLTVTYFLTGDDRIVLFLASLREFID
jgi:hypothetical protein